MSSNPDVHDINYFNTLIVDYKNENVLTNILSNQATRIHIVPGTAKIFMQILLTY